MTQEELDALMNEDLAASETQSAEQFDQNNYRPKANAPWPPPPSAEHRVVHQLDDVAREGEEKSTQIFDILDAVGAVASEADGLASKLLSGLSDFEATFEKLKARFPQIKAFAERVDRAKELRSYGDRLKEIAQKIGDQSMAAMDVMQFQDIHRQKIERVINVMRALSRYMNSLFDTNIADDKRVSSAVHIAGDATEDVVDEEDIEALIAAFGGKK
ncbi:MAG: chemotaxis protein [Helicobacteraceae bacterium]|jgi:chemotaxis regulatin CheY-phosphate phosphatase CheZ|nr:chemotaxis protein [Helicobacteraceae bacterium]